MHGIAPVEFHTFAWPFLTHVNMPPVLCCSPNSRAGTHPLVLIRRNHRHPILDAVPASASRGTRRDNPRGWDQPPVVQVASFHRWGGLIFRRGMRCSFKFGLGNNTLILLNIFLKVGSHFSYPKYRLVSKRQCFLSHLRDRGFLRFVPLDKVTLLKD
jgi:hypothetical protein